MNEQIKQILTDKTFKENYSDSEIKEISVWIDGVVNQADKEEIAEQDNTDLIPLERCNYCGDIKECKTRNVYGEENEIIEVVDICKECLDAQNGEVGF